MKLDEFIEKHRKGDTLWPNAWVNCEGFTGMYVRVNKRYILGEYLDVIDLANIEVEHPGRGTFRRLITHLTSSFSEYTIHVESVLSERFRGGLLRMGFKQTQTPYNYYLHRGS